MSRDEWLDDADGDGVEYRVWMDILDRYGRPDGSGPDVCEEAAGLTIFDDEDAARAAAHDLHEAGAPLLEARACPFDEHWHLRRAQPPTPDVGV